ncbi:MAG: PTS sugar transporter subunit IIA [Methylacidiphilales bacterium]|nr:PTS sugar transporter subunit IIA [Candidatus Methylacidiphilales bacterium]
MKSLLNALQDGRLIELPDNNKQKALEYLATLIEAIPDIGVEGGITETVLAREQSHNTGIGKGWGCPHARSSHDGELLCAVGWSPSGIDYGSPDNEPVHIVVMYFVPDTQKNAYLKEISSLAKAILTQPDMQDLKSLTDLTEVRHRLLDAISAALESSAPEAKARMIQLEAKHAEAKEAGTALPADIARRIVPLSILAVPGARPVVLCLDREIVALLESKESLASDLAQSGQAEHQGVRVMLRGSSNFQPDRVLYECLAFKLNGQPAQP